MILLTKVIPPQTGERVIDRARLRASLDAALAEYARVIAVTAPAGFGKTTLLASWLRTLPPGFATGWVSLDEGDNQPAQLVTYLAAALGMPLVGAGLDEQLIALTNALTARAERTVLVLDDTHVLLLPEAQRVLRFLAGNLPGSVTLVFAGRLADALPMGRLRAAGRLAEMGCDALRFTAEEAAVLLNGAHGLALKQAELDVLHERTDGWAAGLQLAASALRLASDRSAAVCSFDARHAYVRAYFDEEAAAQTGGEAAYPAQHALHRLFVDYLRDRGRMQAGGAAGAPPRRASTQEALSARESEVLRLVARGLSNREIAQRICVAPGTVKRHLHNIFSKLNLRNRAEAVAYLAANS